MGVECVMVDVRVMVALHAPVSADDAFKRVESVLLDGGGIEAVRRLPEVADAQLASDEKLSDPEQSQLGPFARESETSRKAALANYPRQGSQRWRILDQLALTDRYTSPGQPRGMTREELATALGVSGDTIRPRVIELIDGGWVEESGDLRRKTRAGNDAALVMLTEKARKRLVEASSG